MKLVNTQFCHETYRIEFRAVWGCFLNEMGKLFFKLSLLRNDIMVLTFIFIRNDVCSFKFLHYLQLSQGRGCFDQKFDTIFFFLASESTVVTTIPR